MTTLLDELTQIISALEDGGIEYALCGGLALTVHGFARARYGIDILIRPESLEKSYEIAAENGFDKRGLDMSLEKSAVEIQRVSKIDDDGEVLSLKFLLVNQKIEDVWETREALSWENKTLRVVSRNGLIKMKKLAGRTQDLVDIERLKNEES